MPARSPCDRTRHGLGGQMLPRAGVRGILGGVRAPAPLEAAVQRSSPAISTGSRRRAI